MIEKFVVYPGSHFPPHPQMLNRHDPSLFYFALKKQFNPRPDLVPFSPGYATQELAEAAALKYAARFNPEWL